MKKLISFLLLCASAIILSSCIVVTDRKHELPFLVDLTFMNDTKNSYIEDWYAEDKSGRNYTKSDNWTPVRPGKSSTLYDLYPAEYKIRFTYDYNNHPYYYESNYSYIDEDTTFYLSDETFFSRSAEDLYATAEPKFVLTDNKGNIIPLELVD